MSEESYFDASKIVVKPIEVEEARKMIVKNHYSHKWSLCQVAYGVYYKTGKDDAFFDAPEEKSIGCVVYATPVGRSAATSISPLINTDEVFELVRLWIADGYGKNIESYCIAQTFKLLKRDHSNIKAIISYSDVEQSHSGTIYQSTNFIFTGLNSETNLMPNFSISLTNNPYKWMHSRTAFSTYGSHNVEHLKKRIGHTFWRKKESGKYRYVYILSDKKTKKQIMKTFKMAIKPYPKNCNYVDEIQEIAVTASVEKPFFD
jgi:hypothetical protein